MSQNDVTEQVRDYDILDTPAEEEFDAITRLAAEICDTPVAMINFVDEDRFWNKSSVGLDADVNDLSRNDTVCNHTIEEDHKLIVEDLSKDERFRDNPYVCQHPNFRFYAGITIKSTEDYNIGTLCVFDKENRTLTDKQEQSLKYLADEISTRLELRRKRRQLKEQNQELHDQFWFLKNTADLMFQVDPGSATITSARNGNKETIGFTNDELKGKQLFDVFEKIEPERELRSWMDGADSDDSFEQEAMLVTKTGRQIWCKIVATKNEESIYLTARNITEKHVAREKLIAESELNQKLIQNLPGLFCLFDEEGKIISWNNNFLEKGNFTEEDLDKRPYFDNYFHSSENDREIEEVFKAVFEHGEVRAECLLKSGAEYSIPILMNGFRIDSFDQSQAVAIAIDISNQKKAERKLADEKLRFELATDVVSDIIFDWSMQDDVVWRSEGMEDLLGYKPQEIESSFDWWMEHIHPEDRQRVTESFTTFLETDEAEWSESYRFQKSNGGYAYLQAQTHVIRTDDGTPLRCIGALVDVTEQREARQELTEALDKLHNAQKIANLGYFEWNLQENRLFWSDEALRIYGLQDRSGPFAIEDFRNLIHKDDIEKVDQILEQTMRGENVELVHRIITSEGQVKYIQQRAEVSVDQEGEPAMVSGTAQDVTAQVQQRQKLERFSKVVTETSNLVVITGPDGKTEWVNQPFEEYTGYTLDEMKGKKPGAMLQGPRSSQEAIDKMSENIAEGKPVTVEIINYSKMGEPYWVEISIDPVHNEEGEIEEFFAIQKDITERKESENKLQKSLEEKQVLLAEIHHRVKNNMAIISGLLELEAMQADNEEFRTIMRESQMRIQSMAMIHEKLYNANDFTNLSFGEYVDSLIASIRDTYGFTTKGITIQTEIESLDMNINQAIPTGLLLHELITNIIKHGFEDQYSDEGKIKVNIRREDQIVEIGVSDDGKGVPDDFSYKDRSTLGATLIQTLLKQLNASLDISSGDTTTFTIRFKLDKDKQGSAANSDIPSAE